VFLDINMPELNGLELAAMIPPSTKVIFTTAYREYALESYSVHAADYLLKPLSYVKFLTAVRRLADGAAVR
jgi:two-component system LytT family response regulator